MRLFATSEGLHSAATPFTPAPANQERRGWLKKLGAALGLGLLGGPALAAAPRGTRQVTGVDPFIGEIMLFAGNFPVSGYAMCDGQLMSIAQNQALFSLLGTMYGGNGQTTFALPDLRGRFPMHTGQGPGLTPHSVGDRAGAETTTLLTTQMPAHNHTLGVSSAAGTTTSPAGSFPAVPAAVIASTEENLTVKGYGTTTNAAAAPTAIGAAGGGQPHSNMNPYLALNFQIATQGVYPSRA